MDQGAHGAPQDYWFGGDRDNVSRHSLSVEFLKLFVSSPHLHALKNLPPWCRYMPALVEEAVKAVLNKLGRPALHVADMPVDLEKRVTYIQQRLAGQAASSAAVLGLHGMGGIGKTTLAKAVYNALRIDFDGNSCFLEVGREAKEAKMQQLQRKMLRELCGVAREVYSVDEGLAELQRGLCKATVLLVIDDLWLSWQLDALLVPLGPGSRVLLTTRDAHMLRYHDIESQPVDVLDSAAELELFCGHAFRASRPPTAYRELADEAVEKCAGLPLTISVVGSFLRGLADQATWRAALAALQAAQPLSGCRTEDDALWGRLKVSYDMLGPPEKEMFLDIACCMLGKGYSATLPAWGRLGELCLGNLVNKSLVRVGNEGQLEMHDQLRDMGQQIVKMEEPLVPALRSRVWMPDAMQLGTGQQVRQLLHMQGRVERSHICPSESEASKNVHHPLATCRPHSMHVFIITLLICPGIACAGPRRDQGLLPGRVSAWHCCHHIFHCQPQASGPWARRPYQLPLHTVQQPGLSGVACCSTHCIPAQLSCGYRPERQQEHGNTTSFEQDDRAEAAGPQ